MKIDEAMSRMQEIAQDGDIENGHHEADNVLCEFLRSLGYTDLVEVFESLDKWYA